MEDEARNGSSSSRFCMRYRRLDEISREGGLATLYTESFGGRANAILVGETFSPQIDFARALFIKIQIPIDLNISISNIERRLEALGIKIIFSENSLILYDQNEQPVRVVTIEGTYPQDEGLHYNLELIANDIKHIVNSPVQFLETYFLNEI